MKLTSLIVLLGIFQIACAWGPLTHLYFACEAYEDPSQLNACLNSISSQNVFWGGLLPDGLTEDPYSENNNCSWSPHTHDPLFAGILKFLEIFVIISKGTC